MSYGYLRLKSRKPKLTKREQEREKQRNAEPKSN